MKKVLCGVRPTGKMHLGHYFSVIKPALENNATVLIATYHANNEESDCLDALISFGVKHIIMQEDVFNANLYFNLLQRASMGDLQRMTQYKSSDHKTPHLLVYPVLMAHDIAGYDEVVVGEDQMQHLEFSRTLLKKVGMKCPKAIFSGGRIMSLTDSSKKMSKSEPKGCLFLSDAPDEIRKKIRKAVTDPRGRENLIFIFKSLGGDIIPDSNEELKNKLSDLLIIKICGTL